MSHPRQLMLRGTQFSLRSYRRDAFQVLSDLRSQQGDVALARLGGQRLVYISDATLIADAFRNDRTDRLDQVRRWWLRPRGDLRPSGILFDTHDKLAHRNARAEFNEVFSNRRARGDAPDVAELMSEFIALQAERGSCDLRTFVGGLLVAGLSLSMLGRRLTLDEASQWMLLYGKSSRIISSSMFAPGLAVDLIRRLARLSDLRSAVPALFALEDAFSRALDEPSPLTLGAAFHAAEAGDRADLLTRMVMSPIQLAASMFPVWFALSNRTFLSELRRDPANGHSQALLRGIVMEGARLVSPLVIGRVCLEPFKLGNIQVRRNDFLFASPFLVHRDERWWPDPESMQPERWSQDAVANRPLGAFLTFGVPGPRMCPGRHQAVALLETAVQVTVADWDIEFLDDIQPLRWIPRVSNDDVEPDRELSIRFVRRQT